MAEIRINATGGVKLYDADDSHYAQIVAGTITSNVDAITLGHNIATFNAAITAGGVLKTDDATEATSTTDGSLQTDGGLSVVKDAVFGDDVKLLSDSSVVAFGADGDTTLTHTDGTGLTLNSTNKLTFGDAASFIQQSSDGVLRIDGEATVDINASAAVTIAAAGVPVSLCGITFYTPNSTSMYTHDVSATDNSADYNTAYGWNALDAVTTGDKNICIGYQAGTAIDSGGDSVYIGTQAGAAVTTGTNNTAIGTNAADGFDTETHNLAIGTAALGGSVAGGEYNVAVGNYSLDALTSGDFNVAVGYDAGTGLTTGGRNIAIGYQAMADAAVTGTSSVYIGYHAGKAVTSADSNVVIGHRTALSLTTQTDSVFIGEGAALDKTTGSNCVFMGHNAGCDHDTESNNLAIGSAALGGPIAGGEYNVAIGNDAGGKLTSGEQNVIIGYQTGEDLTTAQQCTLVGRHAGVNVTTGQENTCFGDRAGETITTGANNIILGPSADTPAADTANAIVIGSNITGAANDFTFGKYGNTVANDFDTDNAWTQSSDVRKKKNIKDAVLGLDFVNDLRPVTYEWRPSYDFPKDFKEYNKENQMTLDTTMHGLVAQEVKEALDKTGVERFGGWKEDKDGCQRISKEMFVFPLIKAVQELSAQVTTLQDEINNLKGE